MQVKSQKSKVKSQKCSKPNADAHTLRPETLLPFDFCLLTFVLPFSGSAHLEQKPHSNKPHANHSHPEHSIQKRRMPLAPRLDGLSRGSVSRGELPLPHQGCSLWKRRLPAQNRREVIDRRLGVRVAVVELDISRRGWQEFHHPL